MKKILGLTLGIMTALSGFVDLGQIAVLRVPANELKLMCSRSNTTIGGSIPDISDKSSRTAIPSALCDPSGPLHNTIVQLELHTVDLCHR